MRSATARQWRTRLLIFIPFALAAGSTSRADNEQYLIEYRAFREALTAGNGAAATSHAHAAWQAAETELGNHPTTAILAYNYARLLLSILSIPRLRGYWHGMVPRVLR
jgi:hypothetical protein